MRKKILTIMFAGLAAMQLAGCGAVKFKFNVNGPSVHKESSLTVDGKTEGHSERKSADRGSASFNIEDNKVELTNVSFKLPKGYNIDVKTVDDSIVYNRIVITPEGDISNTIVSAVEGTYKEPLTDDNYTEALNEIMKPFNMTGEIEFKHQQGMMMNEIDDDYLYSMLNFENGGTGLIRTSEDGEYYIAIITDRETWDEHEKLLSKMGFGDLIDYANEYARKQLAKETEPAREVAETIEVEGELIRETNGNPDEFKEGNKVETEAEELEAKVSEVYSSDVDECHITLDGEPFTFTLPKGWVSNTSEHIIFVRNSVFDNVSTDYSDSYIDVGDTESLNTHVEAVKNVTGKDVKVFDVPSEKGHGTSYVIYYEADGYNITEILQPVPGYNHYLDISIDDLDQKYDYKTLIGAFALDFTD